MEIYGLLVVSILTLLLGVASLFQHVRDTTVYYFFATVLGTSFWALGLALFLSASSPESATLAASFYYSAAALIAIATAFTGLSMGRDTAVSWRVGTLLLVPFLGLVIVLFVTPELLFTQVTINQDSPNTITLSPVYYLLYGVYFISYFSTGLVAMFRQMRRSHRNRRLQMRLRYVLGAYASGGVIGVWFNLILPWTGDYSYIWVGPLGLMLFVPIVYIAIIKYGLFDVRAAVLRAVTYTLVLAVLTIVYYLLAYGASVVIFGGSVTSDMSVSPVNVAIALVLAFLFQPLKRFFDKLTNTVFYRSTYDSEEFYAQLNTLIRSNLSLKSLLRGSATLIEDTLKAEYVSFLVYRQDGATVTDVSSSPRKKMAPGDMHLFDELREPLYVEDSHVTPAMRKIFVSYRISIIVPLYRADTIIGIMCLGDRKISKYSSRDIRVLKSAAGELVVGIQNTLVTQEIRDLNENLQQRIDSATKELRRSNAQLQRLDETKDEFISMASHQLRTPLTSIKGYLSMLIDEDLGKVTPQQKQVLEEAFSSSERMVHLIGDFLNVSRLQTGKFVIEKQPTNLSELVKCEVESLQKTADGHELKLKYSTSKDIPEMNIDADKFKQVIMNFIDNAIYYSKEGTTVQISVKRNGSSVEFLVKDTGIGVPQSEQAGLFGKFFRASNARRTRPDGTGVGLFLAKKVVSDHRGQVIFESEEGKGSTFGFSLPLPAEQVQK